MRKEAEDRDSPKRSIRDSGYIDCWESERSDSLSPPKHTRDDSFDSLDSIGSRSRQTPSPDGLLARGYSDDRGSDSDCDTPNRKMPDIRKDDMLVRRTSCSEPRTPVPFNQYLPNRSNQSSYMPAPMRRPRADREESRKSWSNATSPVGGERPFSDHQMRSPCPPKDHFSPSVQTQPIEQNQSDSQKMDEETERDGWDFLHSDLQMLHNQTAGNDARFRRTSSVFDDNESVSMIDMRSEEDSLSPHSQVRHELMHNQYNKLKEDEDYWQDDLARWKSRRRSVSQDLIKKEEERKMMERMMSGDECSQRRKSIKTYREIVEEKERREQELHEAYRNARTPEEASAVLQKYAQRFTISEAILERLKLPKLLERSVSADPTRHSSTPVSLDISSTSNAMQYLRQQSLPTPKFTSTVEARVTGFTVEQGIKGDAENILGPARSLASKPYRQSGRAGLRTAKVDEAVNGERDDDVHSIEEEERGESDRHREEESLQFFPSPSQHTEIRQTDVSEVSYTDTHQMTEIKREMIPQAGATSISPKVSEPKTEENVADKGKSTENHTSMHTDASDVNQCESNVIQTDASAAQVQKPAMESPPKPANQSYSSIPELNGTAPVCQTPNTEMAKQSGNVPPMVLNLMKRVEHISWSPEEERKRQKKWQEEQERMLQEKYRREQEKLKHEWELAQKEVEEEERRYHEEERKILEETVTPLTPHGPITPSALPITHSTLHNNNSANAVERQTTVQMTVSSSSQDCGTVSYGQKGPKDQSQEKQVTSQSSQGVTLLTQKDVSLSNKQQPQQAETLKKTTSQTKPGERKRSDSIENIVANSSSSSSFTDTDTQPPPSPNRSVSGKKLCSSCGHPLGKGAAMIIETLSLYFHIQCFKCGICKGQLGDTSTGTDVRIRNGLLNCHQCYIHSRSAGQPTTL